MRFGPDGHLRVYEWNQEGFQWKEVADLLKTDNCSYPMVCGTYGICKNSHYSCPLLENGTDYFKEVNERELDSGCSSITPISCESSQNWHILELENVTYFKHSVELQNVNSKFCKQALMMP